MGNMNKIKTRAYNDKPKCAPRQLALVPAAKSNIELTLLSHLEKRRKQLSHNNHSSSHSTYQEK
ncbi:hypothetical protein HYC85_018130 [Camellia sinensis]|uniref:Uncharacterized protein n=1 Tax=Camellia sinensis TaxID=4442 RepID=A0A7J7GTF2_CAMSI|nr:hypothetical protein HYC85_018130 [Camellia sinensis]